MPYALFEGNARVSELFVTEHELWVHVCDNGLCLEVIDNEDMPPRRVLDPKYLIHVCRADGIRPDAEGPPLKSWR